MSFVTYIITAIAMVMVIEGLLYALFPELMKTALKAALEMDEASLRKAGFITALAGFAVIWLMGIT